MDLWKFSPTPLHQITTSVWKGKATADHYWSQCNVFSLFPLLSHRSFSSPLISILDRREIRPRRKTVYDKMEVVMDRRWRRAREYEEGGQEEVEEDEAEG